ncbi:MAG: succinate dehydrogenase, cytochrome b556 subunit [Proteobacteria bacterium]|nr:succinate dehydrogenase, cytochrome b556 subunit [Pseudomonadota bacterium]
MNKSGRPLSPHVSIYRWPITMTLSILHRVTGVALSVGLIVLTIWLVALSTGAAAYEQITALMQSIVGRLLLAGFSFAFFFHLCNGVRHLFWDVGKGFEMRQANASAWSVVLATSVLTLGLWLAL